MGAGICIASTDLLFNDRTIEQAGTFSASIPDFCCGSCAPSFTCYRCSKAQNSVLLWHSMACTANHSSCEHLLQDHASG